MEELLIVRQFIDNAVEVTKLISELEFIYDAPGEFEEHKRYIFKNDTYSLFLTEFTNRIYDNISKRTGCDIIEQSSLTESLLINKYEGHEECSWHRDFDEPWFNDANIKAIRFILTLGPDKIFKISNKSQEITTYTLSSGDVVILGEGFDELYQHSVPTHNDDKLRYTYMLTLGIKANEVKQAFENLKQ